MIDVNWSEVGRIIVDTGIVIGLIAGVVTLSFVVTRPTVDSFLQHRWAWLIGAGLILGGIDAVWLALHVTNGHPSIYNALLWIGFICFSLVFWLGIYTHLPRRLGEAQKLMTEDETPQAQPAELAR